MTFQPLAALWQRVRQFSPLLSMLAVIAGSALISWLFGDLIGDLAAICGFAALIIYRQRQQHGERSALLARMAPRIRAALDTVLAHQVYEIVQLKEWPLSRLVAWPDSPEHPAPAGAWDVTVRGEGQSELMRLTLYLDAHLYALPCAETSDDQTAGAGAPHVCPFCPHGELYADPDGVPRQVGESLIWYYTWRGNRCTYVEHADVLGHPEPAEPQPRDLPRPGAEPQLCRLPNNVCLPRQNMGPPIPCEIADCEELAVYDCYPAIGGSVTSLEKTIALCERHAREVDPTLRGGIA